MSLKKCILTLPHPPLLFSSIVIRFLHFQILYLKQPLHIYEQLVLNIKENQQKY